MSRSRITLSRYLIEKNTPNNLNLLIECIASACQEISYYISKGELENLIGSMHIKNIQGEIQQKLDIISNKILLKNNEWTGTLAGIASEEMESPYQIPKYYPKGEYLLIFDPLDGSSNININVTIGTIFSILHYPNKINNFNLLLKETDFLQPGIKQIAAGYAIYGPQTMFILTLRHTFEVKGFTLDRELGSFILTHNNINIPESTSEFAINMSNKRHWEKPVLRYIDELLAGEIGKFKKNYNMRWIASMVADIHRILTRGGIFMYPYDLRTPEQPGKLRLMYEANPMSLIIENAGGLATDGYNRILNLTPNSLHQRIPVFIGSTQEVNRITEYHKSNK